MGLKITQRAAASSTRGLRRSTLAAMPVGQVCSSCLTGLGTVRSEDALGLQDLCVAVSAHAVIIAARPSGSRSVAIRQYEPAGLLSVRQSASRSPMWPGLASGPGGDPRIADKMALTLQVRLDEIVIFVRDQDAQARATFLDISNLILQRGV